VLVGPPDLVGHEGERAAYGQRTDEHVERVVAPPHQEQERAAAEGGRHGDADQSGDQVGQVPLDEGDVADEGADHADLAVGEVQRPRLLVDQGDPEGDETVDGTDHEPVGSNGPQRPLPVPDQTPTVIFRFLLPAATSG
jgi:hypothetical protein